MRTTGLLMAMLMGLAACAAPSNEPEASRASDCQPVSRTTLDAIEQGLTVSGGGTLRNGWTVQRGDWWYIAAEIDGAGMEDEGQVGIWATDDPETAGTLIMADAIAREFSDWGTQTGAENLGIWMQGFDAAACFD